jgi:hypothetical protein
MSAFLMVKINTKASPPCVVEAAITSSDMLSVVGFNEAWLCMDDEDDEPGDAGYYQEARDRLMQRMRDAPGCYGWLLPYLRDDDPLKLCHPTR